MITLHSSEENLWSILYLTGYLTKLPASALASPLPQDIFALTIPNAEIQEIFETTILKWFQDSAKTWNKTGSSRCCLERRSAETYLRNDPAPYHQLP